MITKSDTIRIFLGRAGGSSVVWTSTGGVTILENHAILQELATSIDFVGNIVNVTPVGDDAVEVEISLPSPLNADTLEGNSSSNFSLTSHNHTHNNLESIQGGTSSERYHLTNEEKNNVHSPYLIGTKQIDETGLGNGYILVYRTTTNKLQYALLSHSSLPDLQGGVEGERYHLTLAQLNNIHSSSVLGTKSVNEANVGNGKVLIFDSSSNTLLYASPGSYALGDMQKSSYDSNGDGIVNSADHSTTSGDADTVDGRHASAFALTSHIHDDRYYTESESDSKYSPLAHTHDDRYFTETEADARFSSISHLHDTRYSLVNHNHNDVYSLLNHTHDDRYFTETESDARYSQLSHIHDDRYYTKTQTSALYSSTGHIHDDRYFTETESDLRFAAIAHLHDGRYSLLSHNHNDVYSLLGHIHDDRYFTESESDNRYSQLNHTHDDRYYTESEADSRFSLSSHLHDDRYSLLSHNHDGVYSSTGHIHDSRYYTKEQVDELISSTGGVTDHNSLENIQGGNENERFHLTSTGYANSHSPYLLGTKEIDESSIGNSKVIAYDSNSGKLTFVTAGSGSGDMLKSVYDSNDDGIVNQADYSTSTGNATTLDGKSASEFSSTGHIHDERYSQLDHTHDDRYFTEDESDVRYSSTGHIHDNRYFTEDEANSRFSSTGHIHDDRYFTESESDLRYSSTGHLHTEYSLIDGTRDYTGIVGYDEHKTFVSDEDIVDKKYVDDSYSVIPDITKEPTGFETRSTSTLSFDDNPLNPTFLNVTISPTSTSFNVWSKGVKFIKTTESVAIDNTQGLWYIYYDTSGVLSAMQSIWDFIDGNAPVATVYWDGTTGLLCDERHGLIMDGMTHAYLHYAVGVRYYSGLAGTFTNTTFEITDGYIIDEDIRFHVTPTQTQCRVFYRQGGFYKFTVPQTKWYYEVSNIVQYDNDGTITPVDNNKYAAMWFFAVNDVDYPIYVLTGQRQDTTLANAKINNTYQGLSLLTLPSQEMKLLYRVIIRRDGTSVTFVEAEDYRSVSNLPASTYVATRHSSLTGLDSDDHLQYLTNERADLRYSSTGHIHDDRYFTEEESDERYSSTGHLHDERYYTELESDERYSSTGHIHSEYSNIDGSVDYTGVVSYNEHKEFSNDTDIVDKKFVVDYVTSTGGAGALADLSDVLITDPQYNNILKYTSTGWINTSTGLYPITPSDYTIVTSTGDFSGTDCLIYLPFSPMTKECITVSVNFQYIPPSYYTVDGELLTITNSFAKEGDTIYVKNISLNISLIQTSLSGVDSPFTLYHDGTDGHFESSTGDLYIDTVNTSTGLMSDGAIRSHGKIYNAVWNDYADFWDAKLGIDAAPGYCYSDYGKGLEITRKRADKCCIGVCSDTFGHGMGYRKGAIPIAVAGFVLAYVDDMYSPGTLLTCNKKGVLTKAGFFDILFRKIVAKYIRLEYNSIYNNSIIVNGRSWVKVL